MAVDEATVVPVASDDTVDSVITRIRNAGAASVQLLVPDDTAALQTPRGWERLLRALDADSVALLVITSDEQILDAARRNQIATVGVAGARVRTAPPAVDAQPNRYTTQVLPKAPIDARDAAFLDALDQASPGERYAGVPDDELYEVLDELPDAYEEPAPAGRRAVVDDDFAAELDTLSDLSAAATVAGRALPPNERNYAADVDLDDDALSRQRAGRRTTTSGAARRQSGATGRLYDDAEATYAPRPSATLRWLLPIVIVALLALALAFWLISSRTTVTVAPPASTAGAHPFNGEVIPLAAAGSSAGTAVQASPVTAEAEATVPGQVQTETLSPSGTAKGVVTVRNTIGNPVPVPKGSEFIGKNDKGQEVRFTVDSDVTVPGSTTTSSLEGNNTSYGKIDISITARSPGSASNVPENSITQLLIPGQQPFVSQNSNFIFQNAAITGGSEAKQRIVTEGDVQGVLQAALTQLYNSGVQQLGAQIDGAKFQIDQTTIAPSAAELGSPQSYEPPVVEPPVGQAVDPNNPNFKVTVRARFSALATPKGKPVGEQLKTVAPQYLVQRGGSPCKAAERPATSVTNWRWDGQKLTIDGSISCLPATGLPPDVIGRVKDALRGQTRDAAETSLRALQQQGLIGEYALPPDKASFPRFDWLITVNVVEPPPVQQQPTQKATS